MPIHPMLEPVLAYMRDNPGPNPIDLPLSEVRANHLATSLATDSTPPEMESVTDITIPTREGMVEARVYVPRGVRGNAIGIYFHGGGFVLGTLDSYDTLARRLAEASGISVISVAYRLAPEHPFPAAIHDGEDAVRWVAEHREQFGAPDAGLLVLGDSAGGCIAAAVANVVTPEIPLIGQVLLYPTLGPEVLTASSHNYATGYFLEMDHLRHNYAMYLQGWTDHTDPRVTPLLAEDLSASPTAIVVVAECDPLRDEGVNYAGLLEHFNVHVDLLEAKGMPHSFFKLGGLVPDALEEMADLGVHIRKLIERSK